MGDGAASDAAGAKGEVLVEAVVEFCVGFVFEKFGDGVDLDLSEVGEA